VGFLSEIYRDGFSICRGALSPASVAELKDSLESIGAVAGVYGLRNLLRRSPAIRAAAHSADITGLVTAVLGTEARPVRAILFDKQPGANWGVGWHQDLTIAVRQRIDIAGFTAWTVKDGVPHVQPPVEILERMLTLRLHLDATDGDNGALIVMPGTHSRGRVHETWVASDDAMPVICAAAAGDILAFRPLLLHMSRRSARPAHRRVIQIEYAAAPLPPPLMWYTHDEDRHATRDMA
jgi:ectoine hydroxylase-related dioxygenase (phytanoyl-CoA dioxygenase family)